MSAKFKALGLSLLAVMAASAFVVMNASAEVDTTKGHFTSDAPSGLTELDIKKTQHHYPVFMRLSSSSQGSNRLSAIKQAT